LINLRGQIITAVDLRTCFQIPDRDRDDPPPPSWCLTAKRSS
jgi:chemotaxis signal transduction protein